MSAVLLVLALLGPLAAVPLALRCRGQGRRTALLVAAPLPALLASLAVARGHELVLDPAGLGMGLVVDTPRAILLAAIALLWSIAGASAARLVAEPEHRTRFLVCWLLSLAGCTGTILARDLVLFYLFFGLASLPVYGLVVHDGSEKARRAAILALSLAVVGEAFLLLAFVLLSAGAPGESIAIADVVASLLDSPYRTQTLVFLLLGFGLKMGLVPLHGWLPLVHPAAPAPASAILSGTIIKTGVIGLCVFLPFGSAAPHWADALLAIGFATAFLGAIAGLLQPGTKTILAYSSVSQMGLVAAMLGAAWTGSTDAADGPIVATLHAAHHALVKGALFLGVGAAALLAARWRRAFLAPMAILSLALAGLPGTSGAWSKDAAKLLFAASPHASLLSLLALLSTIGSAALMTRFLLRFRAEISADDAGRRGDALPFAIAFVASLLLPLAFALLAPEEIEVVRAARSSIAQLLWPIAIGVAMGALLDRVLQARSGPRPEGLAMAAIERLGGAIFRPGAWVDRLDARLRRWPVAVGGALALALLLARSILS